MGKKLRKHHKFAGLLLILIIPLIAAGCWNRTEPELLALVLGLGVDYDRQSKQYEVVVDIANPSGMAGGGSNGGGGNGGQGGGSYVTSAKGKTLFEALREIEPVLSRELFWGHSEEVIVTEELARSGIRPLFDFYARERHSRQSNFILVTDEDLRELLQIKQPLEIETGVGIRRQIQTIQKTRSVIPLADVRQALIDFNLPGKEIFVPRIRLKTEETKPDQGVGQGGEISPGGGTQGSGDSQPKQIIEISGGAAFLGDRFAGWVDPVATKGWLFIVGGSRRATVTISCPDFGGDSSIAIKFHQASSRIEAVMKNGKPKIKVVITLEGRLEEKDFPGRFTEEYIKKLHGELVKAVKKKAQTAVNRAQELRSDIFGFGNAIYRRHPREWDKLERNWEEHFTRLEVEIEVNAHIRRSGLVVDPPGS